MSMSATGTALTFRKGTEDPAVDVFELPQCKCKNGLPEVINMSDVQICLTVLTLVQALSMST